MALTQLTEQIIKVMLEAQRKAIAMMPAGAVKALDIILPPKGFRDAWAQVK